MGASPPDECNRVPNLVGGNVQQQILIIDDSKPIHTLIISLLSDELAIFHSAYEGGTGMVVAASLRPDLILLDVEMPGMDGYEVCRQLRADPNTASVPIIFLTARAATEEMVHGLNLGGNDYVTKPFKLSELLSRVRAALRTSRLVRMLEEKALIDPLTGLGNRAMFKERFAAEVAMRIRSGDPLSCIVLDVDHFKNINDRYGHPFGDEVLRKIGEALTEVCRIEDVACRPGGDEFVILAPQTTAEQASLAAERMRAAIASMAFVCQDESVSVTCSFGVAEGAGVYDRLMLDRADQALYQSKQRGGNCISLAGPHPTLATAAA
jgi:diguanylate cyclase (GGDEF)-like protein